MTKREREHYMPLVYMLLFEKIDHKYVVGVDDDYSGCTVMVEHIDYLQSPALLNIRW